MITIQLSVGEARMIIEALIKRANRHDAEGRARPLGAGLHDRIAFEMRTLAERLLSHTRRERGRAIDQRTADRIDGYDRDDLGESPDY